MSEWLTKKLNESLSQGMSQGFSQGEAQMGRLINQLLKEGRTEDISRATEDPEYRKHLYQEFQIA